MEDFGAVANLEIFLGSEPGIAMYCVHNVFPYKLIASLTTWNGVVATVSRYGSFWQSGFPVVTELRNAKKSL